MARMAAIPNVLHTKLKGFTMMEAQGLMQLKLRNAGITDVEYTLLEGI
jgi:hypothetical protein